MMLANGTIMDLTFLLKFILVVILLILGFLAWLQNKVENSNEENKNSQMEEVCGEENQILFEQEGGVSEYLACSFCGKLSNIITRCLQCKNVIYCSKACHEMDWRFWHRDEGVETKDANESSLHGGQCFFLALGNETSNYSFNDVDEEETYEGDVYYIEGGENSNIVESINETTKELQHVNNYNNSHCAVCGNPCSKKCSRCKVIKYCSETCQHFDWKSGHKFQCCLKKTTTSTQEQMTNQAYENVIMSSNLDELKDNDHSYDPLCLEFCSEENTKALTLSSHEASNKVKEVEQQLRNLKEELEIIRNENLSMQSKVNYWEIRGKYSADRLYSYKKENEHKLLILKHENEMISNAETQARQMVTNLSQRLHCLQIAMETGVAERKNQEEIIHNLQNECGKATRDFQEQNKYVERLIKQNIDNVTQFPMKIYQELGGRTDIASSTMSASESEVTVAEVSQGISLSRNPTLTSQLCTICLTNEKDLAFGCGHMTCRECGSKIRRCHICRKKIANRIRLFHG